MQSVLVTGGAGFIGHHLVKRMLSDYRVVIIDNLSNGKSGNIPKHPNATFYKEDIRNKETISDIIKSHKISTCIHLAAKISVNDSILNPVETVDVNIKGTLAVLEGCAKSNVESFVFASSAAVYGEPKNLPIPEDHILEPLSPYGASKVAGEALATSYRHSGKIIHTACLRFFNVYGEGQNPEYAGVISKFEERLSKGLPPIIYGDGKQTRDFISINDVVDAIIKAAHSRVSGTFNVGTGKPTKIRDLASKMIQTYKLNLKPIFVDGRRGDILQSYADTTKARELLKFVASEDINAGLKKLLHTGRP